MFNIKYNRQAHIAGAQEVGVLRVYDPVRRHGCHRRADRLGKHLSTIDPEGLGVHITANKTVFTIGLWTDNIK